MAERRYEDGNGKIKYEPTFYYVTLKHKCSLGHIRAHVFMAISVWSTYLSLGTMLGWRTNDDEFNPDRQRYWCSRGLWRTLWARLQRAEEHFRLERPAARR